MCARTVRCVVRPTMNLIKFVERIRDDDDPHTLSTYREPPVQSRPIPFAIYARLLMHLYIYIYTYILCIMYTRASVYIRIPTLYCVYIGGTMGIYIYVHIIACRAHNNVTASRRRVRGNKLCIHITMNYDQR